jgi:large subunit ribosomal protein L6
MSRIGKNEIKLPTGVTAKFKDGVIQVQGPQGNLERKLHESMNVVVEGATVKVAPRSQNSDDSKYWGLTRTLVSNMVQGVSTGFTKSLTLVGVGYRAAVAGSKLTLSIGYSHPIDFEAPKGIKIAVDKTTTVIISGADKEVVGQTAATIRGFRSPEPYHGKGVRYSDEVIAIKVGKAGGKK